MIEQGDWVYVDCYSYELQLCIVVKLTPTQALVAGCLNYRHHQWVDLSSLHEEDRCMNVSNRAWLLSQAALRCLTDPAAK